MIFISYRISDSNALTARLDDSLQSYFGKETIFRDKSRLEGGQTWTSELEKHARTCRAMIVIIGPHWKSAAIRGGARDGYPRLSDPEDWVRKEITLAINAGATILPVLAEGATLPERSWLNDVGLERIFSTQYLQLGTDTYHHDLEKIVHAIQLHCPEISLHRPVNDSQSTIHQASWLEALPMTTSRVFVGRTREMSLLDDIWTGESATCVSIIAEGGAGKSALANQWLSTAISKPQKRPICAFGWSFFSQGVRSDRPLTAPFFRRALQWLGEQHIPSDDLVCADRLSEQFIARSLVLVLDGFEPLQDHRGRIRDLAMRRFLARIIPNHKGLCVITSRIPLADFSVWERKKMHHLDLEQLSSDDGVELLRAFDIKGTTSNLESAVDRFRGHCLSLTLLGTYLRDVYNGDIGEADRAVLLSADEFSSEAFAMLRSYESHFERTADVAAHSLLYMLGLFDRPMTWDELMLLCQPPVLSPFADGLIGLSKPALLQLCGRLARSSLLTQSRTTQYPTIDAHPLIREYFHRNGMERSPAWHLAHQRLRDFYHKQVLAHPWDIEAASKLAYHVEHGGWSVPTEERSAPYRNNGWATIDVEGYLIDKLYSERVLQVNEISEYLTTTDEHGRKIAVALHANQFVFLKDIINDGHTGLGRLLADTEHIVPVAGPRKPVFGVMARNLQQTMALDILLDEEIRLVIMLGGAGTGKTLLALAAGMHKVFSEERFDKLLIMRPYLLEAIKPLKEQMHDDVIVGSMLPIFDGMTYLFSTRGAAKANDAKAADSRVLKLIKDGNIVLEPFTGVRGRNIRNQFVICDDAQGLTSNDIRSLIESAGEGTKIVLCVNPDYYLIKDKKNEVAQMNALWKALQKCSTCGQVLLIKNERSELSSWITKNVSQTDA